MNPDGPLASPPEGWHLSAGGIAYPPKPWRLRGVLRGSLWLVPVASVTAFLPEGIAPAVLDEQALVVTGWAVYTPGGVLEYRELLCAVVAGSRRGLGLSVTHVWVDNPTSMAGGRELWGIPKQLARFTPLKAEGFGQEAHDDRGHIATLTFDHVASLPGRWPLLLHTVQALGDGIKITKLRAEGEIGFGHATWHFSEAGPLSFLHGSRPVLNVRLGSAAISFGV